MAEPDAKAIGSWTFSIIFAAIISFAINFYLKDSVILLVGTFFVWLTVFIHTLIKNGNQQEMLSKSKEMLFSGIVFIAMVIYYLYSKDNNWRVSNIIFLSGIWFFSVLLRGKILIQLIIGSILSMLLIFSYIRM